MNAMEPPKPRQTLRLLNAKQKRLLRWVLLGAAFMLANSAYLAWAGHADGVGDDPGHLPVSYQAALILHIAGGIAIFLPAVVFTFWHLQRALLRRTASTLASGGLVFGSVLFLLPTGLFILTAANTRENAWAFLGHQIAALALPAGYLLHRVLGKDRPSLATAGRWIAGMTGLALAFAAVHGLEGRPERPDGDPETWRFPNLAVDVSGYAPAGDPNPENPFFPSSTTTTTGGFLPARVLHKDDLPDLAPFHAETREFGFSPNHHLGAETCDRCHQDIVDQWAVSAHRFASFNNPFYRKSVELTRELVGRETSQWCGGCHDPAIMLAGNMPGEIDPLTPEAQAGLTCMACHAIDRIHNQTGNGAYNIQDATPSPYLFSGSKSGPGRFLHDYVLKAKPNVHKHEMMKPFFRESVFCSACHKVNLDVPVNNYRWFRGQNEFDAWHNSGFAHNNPMTWYEPPEVKTCQDCHMPLEEARLGDLAAKGGKVRSHRFLSVNTALPYIRGDQDSIDRIEKDLQDGKLRVDIFAIHRNGELLTTAPDRTRPEAAPGDVIRVDVVVRNQGVGHTFPGGTNDSNEGWLDFRVEGPDGTVWRHGYIREDKHVDPAAHFYKAVFVDRHGERIARRNPTDIHAPVYVNVIAPSTSDIARYEFAVPEGLRAGSLRIEVALRWRKFNREFTEFVYEGKEVPDLPVTTIETASLDLPVSPAPGRPERFDGDPSQWMRYNDYGIGSVLQGDTRTAILAFRHVAELAPDRVDGWRNMARAYLRDGALEEAERFLREATARAPDDARTAFFWGRLHEERGGASLERAVEAYRRVLQAYPQSRDAWDRLGRVLMHLDRYEEARICWERLLSIDPESALGHEKYGQTLLALSERAGDEETRVRLEGASEIARLYFEKYKIDENADKATLEYRRRHPHDHRMSQQMVVHRQTAP